MSRRSSASQRPAASILPKPRTGLWAIGAIIAATIFAYLPAMPGGFLWDDAAHVTRPELQSLDGLRRIWTEPGATQQYYPLLHTAFWLEHKLWGDDPLGYHLVNLALHCAAIALVYLILRRLGIPVAWLAAGIFALHPVHVESVAWTSEQKNTLSAVFYLAAMLIYLRFDEHRRWSMYLWALALFSLGLASKTVTATLPAALLVIFWCRRGFLSWRRDVLPLVPFFVLGAAAGLFTVWVERKLIGAEGNAFELSIIQRSLLAGRAVWFYLRSLFWPADLIFVYPRWEIDPAAAGQWLYLCAAIALTVALWFMRRRWRVPLAGWLFFVGTLFPVLGFFNVYPFIYSFVADHFQYLASLGIIVLAAVGLALAAARLPRDWQTVGPALAISLLVVLGLLTWRQASTYSNGITLYRTTIQQNPACWMAHVNLSMDLMKAGQLDEAIDQIDEALRLKPEVQRAEYDLAVLLAKTGRASEAIAHFERAILAAPGLAEAHYGLAGALVQAGRPEKAVEHYRQAVQLKPDHVDGINNLAVTLFELGRLEESLQYFEQALRLQPDSADLHNNLGMALAKLERIEDAIDQYREAVNLRPDYAEAWGNLALASAQTHRTKDAIFAANRAIESANVRGQTGLANQLQSWLNSYRAAEKISD